MVTKFCCCATSGDWSAITVAMRSSERVETSDVVVTVFPGFVVASAADVTVNIINAETTIVASIRTARKSMLHNDRILLLIISHQVGKGFYSVILV